MTIENTDNTESAETAEVVEMDYKSAMETLKAIDFEGKEAIVAGIQSGISERNDEAKNYRESMSALKSTLSALTDKLSEATGKQIDPTSEIDLKSVGADLQTLKTEVSSIKEERDTARKEKAEALLDAAITKALAGKVTDESKDDAFELLKSKFTTNTSGEVVSKNDGKKLNDVVAGFLDKRPHFKRQEAAAGAGLRKTATSVVGVNTTQAKVQQALDRIRNGRN